MIRFIVKYCLVLFIACYLGLLIAKDPGYVLFYYQGVSLETSAWCALLILAIVVYLGRSIFRAWHNLRQIPTSLKNYFQDQQEARGFKLNMQAFLAFAVQDFGLAQAHWQEALNSLLDKSPWINFLLASTALNQKNYPLVLTQLNQFGVIDKVIGTNSIADTHAVQLGFIACLSQHMQVDLVHLVTIKSLEIDFAVEMTNHYLRALPSRRWPIKNFEPKQVIINYIAAWLTNLNVEQLESNYQQLPNYLRQETKINVAYYKTALKLGAAWMTETHLRQALNANWSEELIIIYSEYEFEANQQLKWLEKLMKTKQQSLGLHLATAKLKLRLNDLDGAHKTLQDALAISNDAKIYLELGGLYENLGQLEESRKYFKEAARKSLQGAKLVNALPGIST